MNKKRVSYVFPQKTRDDIRRLAEHNKRSMTKELEYLVRKAAYEMEQEEESYLPGTIKEEYLPIQPRHVEYLRELARLDGRWYGRREMPGQEDVEDMFDTVLNFARKFYYTESDWEPASPSDMPSQYPVGIGMVDNPPARARDIPPLPLSPKHRAAKARAARDARVAVRRAKTEQDS